MSNGEPPQTTPGVDIMWTGVLLFVVLLIWEFLGTPPDGAFLIVGIMLMGGAMVAQTSIGRR